MEKGPDHTKASLEGWLPRKLWGNINLLFVGFGQQICQPRAPRCDDCLNRETCPSSSTAGHSDRGKPKGSPVKKPAKRKSANK